MSRMHRRNDSNQFGFIFVINYAIDIHKIRVFLINTKRVKVSAAIKDCRIYFYHTAWYSNAM